MREYFMKYVAFCCTFYLILSTTVLADFSGPVVSVLDGDTIEVLHNQRPERIRLSGIDCPEKGQAFGKRAKQATSELVFGKDVTLQTHGEEKDGRTIGDVILPGTPPALFIHCGMSNVLF
jgi:endonuclease YncB( thermonuclease family)